ncbi:MAG: hypothetical protein WCP92_07535 [bacterium]
MAVTTIRLNKDDITTSQLGKNFMVKCTNDLELVFTPEALDELVKDYRKIKKTLKEKKS